MNSVVSDISMASNFVSSHQRPNNFAPEPKVSEPKIPMMDAASMPPEVPEISLVDRMSALSNGTYAQAYKDFVHKAGHILKTLQRLQQSPNVAPLLKQNIHNIADFDQRLNQSLAATEAGNLGFQDVENIQNLFEKLIPIQQKFGTTGQVPEFKAAFEAIDQEAAQFDTPRMQYVMNLLKALHVSDQLGQATQKLEAANFNENRDLGKFSKDLSGAAYNIFEIASNITAYARSDNFTPEGLQQRIVELPQYFQEFTAKISEVAQNPLVKNNQQFIDLASDVHQNALQVMEQFMPEMRKTVEVTQNQALAKAAPDQEIPPAPDSNMSEAEIEAFIQELQKQEAAENGDNMPNPAPSAPPEALDTKTYPPVQHVNKFKHFDGVPTGPIMPAPSDISSDTRSQDFANFVDHKTNRAAQMHRPHLSAQHSAHSPTMDDPELRSVQGLWDWADQSAHMKNKINAVNEIGQTMEEMAMSGTGKPNPERVALAKRARRLEGIKSLMAETQKTNKATQDLEKAVLDARHASMLGTNQLATQRLKLDIDAAHMNSEQQKTYQKGLEKLGLDALEIATGLEKNYTKLLGLWNKINLQRIDNIWDNIKQLMRNFKF